MNRLFTVAPLALRTATVTARPTSFMFTRMLSTFLPVGEVSERVNSVITNFPKVNTSKLTPQAHFINDLGLDSLDTVELIMAFEEEFVLDIPDDVAEKLLTVEDAVKFITEHPQAR